MESGSTGVRPPKELDFFFPVFYGKTLKALSLTSLHLATEAKGQ